MNDSAKSSSVRVFVAGDRYMKPEILQDVIRKWLGADLSSRLEFRSVTFPYPEDRVPLSPDTVIPSGMSWSDFSLPAEAGGVREFYGGVDALGGLLEDAEVLVVHGAAVPGFVLEQAKSLKLIGMLRGGPQNVDIAAAKRLGIRLVNTPGKTARSVAESTLGGILSLTRNIVRSSVQLQKDRVWVPVYFRYDECGIELRDRVLGIVGFGHIAKELMQLLGGFGLAEILAYDPFRQEKEIAGSGAKAVALDELLARSEIITLHARLSPSSRGMLGRQEFAMMERRPILVNTARGGLIKYRHLIDALREGRVSGAVLDVFGDEPLREYEKLLAMPNVLATPHIAGGSKETVHRAAAMVAEDLRRYLEGLPLVHEV